MEHQRAEESISWGSESYRILLVFIGLEIDQGGHSKAKMQPLCVSVSLLPLCLGLFPCLCLSNSSLPVFVFLTYFWLSISLLLSNEVSMLV